MARKHGKADPPRVHRNAAPPGPEEKVLELFNTIRERYLWQIATVVMVVLIVLLIVNLYRNRYRTDERSSWAQLEMLPEVYPGMPDEEARAQLERIVSTTRGILEENVKTSATPWAMFRLGRAQLELGNSEKAAQTFQKLMDRYEDTIPGRTARRFYGYALEQQQEFEQAAQWFRRIAPEVDGEPMQARSYWDAGRNYEAAAAVDRAREMYQEVLKLQPEGELAELARFRLDSLKLGRVGDRMLTAEPVAPKPEGRPALPGGFGPMLPEEAAAPDEPEKRPPQPEQEPEQPQEPAEPKKTGEVD